MKKVLFTLLLLITFGCHNSNVKTEVTQTYVGDFIEPIQIVEIDSCQYIFGDWGQSTILTHKGNCNNPIHKLK
jgi:hypothetical protein